MKSPETLPLPQRAKIEIRPLLTIVSNQTKSTSLLSWCVLKGREMAGAKEVRPAPRILPLSSSGRS